MSWFKSSDLFRKDVWIARYLAHPLTALVHLSAAGALVAYLQMRPAPEVSAWVWWAFALVPGLWLFFTGFMYMMVFVVKLLNPAPDSEDFKVTFPLVKNTWVNLLLRREMLSAVVLVSLGPISTNWYTQRPFDQEDFWQCTRNLQEPGLAQLAKTLVPGETREQLKNQCATAYRADWAASSAPPATPEELLKRYKQ